MRIIDNAWKIYTGYLGKEQEVGRVSKTLDSALLSK